MDLVIKITIGLFIFSLLLIFFKMTKEFRQNNERDTNIVQSHDPMIHQKTNDQLTKDDKDLVNDIIWEIENST